MEASGEADVRGWHAANPLAVEAGGSALKYSALLAPMPESAIGFVETPSVLTSHQGFRASPAIGRSARTNAARRR